MLTFISDTCVIENDVRHIISGSTFTPSATSITEVAYEHASSIIFHLRASERLEERMRKHLFSHKRSTIEDKTKTNWTYSTLFVNCRGTLIEAFDDI